MTSHEYRLDELDRESRMGGMGTEGSHRRIRCIDLSDFDRRKTEITEQLWDAAVDVGFFQIAQHGIAADDIRATFAAAREFFALPEETKAQYPFDKSRNCGWESKAQVRPSVGTPDQKESYQITRPRMDGLWPTAAELGGFQENMLRFEDQCRLVAMRVLSCFADRLGFDADFFTRAHDPAQETYQSTLRMLHYFPVEKGGEERPGLWRAGAHTDFDCLTLLFQQEGQGGLQVCPGRETDAQEWTPVPPSESVITCNIGDMLMRWSDDRLPSNFHRVRTPGPGDYQGSRYSLAFFAQANRDVVIEGPRTKYPPITAEDYLRMRISANFDRSATSGSGRPEGGHPDGGRPEDGRPEDAA